jgi:murein DD-endopeptidase MepM/ murein hydrolase activator NlpD
MQEFDARRTPARLLPRLLVAAAGFAALILGWRLTATDAQGKSREPLDPSAWSDLQQMAFAQAEASPGFQRAETVTVRVRPGETFETAVLRTGVAPLDARGVVERLAKVIDVAHVKAGMAFEAAIAQPRESRGQVRLIGLSMRTGPATALTISRSFDGALKLRQMEEKVTSETTVATGQLEGSLFESAAKAGATPSITSQVAQLFAHKLDFSRDIQAGDHFSLVFDRQVTESGRTVQTGDLLYAEIDANGSATRFYRFERAGGDVEYFDETGKNIKGFLLRTPVDGARITSTFGMREHPVLGYTRAHQGVDFGAGTGTPILAAGDGIVLEARKWGGYGNWLRIRHQNSWDTGYGHISRYAPGIRPGAFVRQGQVVAYVGATGLATGPHLHYEVWLHGERVNPIGAKVPQGTVLQGRELAAFKRIRTKVDGMIRDAAGGGADTPKLQTADFNRTELKHAGLRPALGFGHSFIPQRMVAPMHLSPLHIAPPRGAALHPAKPHAAAHHPADGRRHAAAKPPARRPHGGHGPHRR